MKNITIAGRVGKTAEQRTTQSGTNVTSWSMAVSHWDGKESQTMWFDVTVWGKRGDAAAKLAAKGAKMCVTGDLSTREYNGKTYLQINASDFTPMGAPQGGGNTSGSSGSYQAPASDGYGAGGQPTPSRELGDEIPFAAIKLI